MRKPATPEAAAVSRGVEAIHRLGWQAQLGRELAEKLLEFGRPPRGMIAVKHLWKWQAKARKVLQAGYRTARPE